MNTFTGLVYTTNIHTQMVYSYNMVHNTRINRCTQHLQFLNNNNRNNKITTTCVNYKHKLRERSDHGMMNIFTFNKKAK